MNPIEANLRSIIRQIINENIESLNEATKGRQFDLYLNHAFEQMKPEIPEGKYDFINIDKEIRTLLNTKLYKVFAKNFDYNNFFIVKLGRFVIKTEDGAETLAFKKAGEEDKRYSYMYVYIYHNTVELIRFGSSFFENDEILMKAAKDYILNKKINLITKTESGKIIIDNTFEKDNVLDLIDYSQVQRPKAPEGKRFGAAYAPKTKYKAGDKIFHRDFGTGIVVSAKKLKTDIPTYDVTAKFKQGEREVEKTIRMQQKTQGQMAQAAQ